MIDGKFNILYREQVLDHYLEKIAGVYDSLYTAFENNVPVNLSQLLKVIIPAAGAVALSFLLAFRLFGVGRFDEFRL